MLVRSAANNLAPTAGGPYPLVTRNHWQIGCLPAIQNGAGQGFLAVSPEGVRYRFDWMATRQQAQLRKGDAVLPRTDFFLMATEVTDRFGNWVRYTYDPNTPLNLTAIDSSDGRAVRLAYRGTRTLPISARRAV